MNHLVPIPLCPSHSERMKVNATLSGYSCPSEGCAVSYTVEDGYIRVVNGVNQKPTAIQRCTECTTHLYLAERGEIRLDDVWLCPNKDCPSKQS
jgi:hypothetical protein